MPPAYSGKLSVKGGEVQVRPIRHEDGPALREMISLADPKDVRSRFHGPVHEAPPSLIARLTDIDYEQEMALIALIEGHIVCVARLVCEPGCETAEFALAVRSDQQRRGIGRGMMGLLIDYARHRGVRRVWGNIEVDNPRMLALARQLGFRPEGPPSFGEVRMGLAI